MIESVLLSETKIKRLPVFYKELQNRNNRLGANFGGIYGIFGIFVVNRREVPFKITPDKFKYHFRSFKKSLKCILVHFRSF